MFEHETNEIKISASQAEDIAEILGVNPDRVCEINITAGLAKITQLSLPINAASETCELTESEIDALAELVKGRKPRGKVTIVSANDMHKYL